MKIWNVGDEVGYCGKKCTITAIQDRPRLAAIQYATGELQIVPLTSLRPDFNEDDKEAIEDIFQVIYAEDDYRDAAESLYLSGYRKHTETTIKDMDNPANWEVGDWVECIEEEDTYVTLGKTYQIEGFSDDTRFLSLRDKDGDIGSYLSECFKFHKSGELK